MKLKAEDLIEAGYSWCAEKSRLGEAELLSTSFGKLCVVARLSLLETDFSYASSRCWRQQLFKDHLEARPAVEWSFGHREMSEMQDETQEASSISSPTTSLERIIDHVALKGKATDQHPHTIARWFSRKCKT